MIVFSDATDNNKIRELAPFLRVPMRTVQMEAQRLLDEVDPGMYVVRWVEVWRSGATQLARWQKGRVLHDDGTWHVVDKSAIVTNAAPGQSPHEILAADGMTPASLAGDLAILTRDRGTFLPDGHLAWGVIPWATHVAAPVELESGAFFHTVPGGDWPHLQAASWKNMVTDGRLRH